METTELPLNPGADAVVASRSWLERGRVFSFLPGNAAGFVRWAAVTVQRRRAETPGMTILYHGTEQVTLVPLGVWELDPVRSIAGFTVRHLKVAKVRGRFGEISGVIRCDEEGVTSIDGRVEVASIDTGDHRRDARLRAEDFFDAERHPTITFTAIGSTGVSVVRGTMMIRGVSRPLQLDAAREGIGGDLRIRANGALSRRAFGLTWDSAFAAGGLMIDDRVGLELDVVLRPRS